IPFKVKVKHKIYDAVRVQQEVAPDEFTVKTIRNAVTSPDGKFIVFNAVGHIWKKQLPDGKPVRLTQNTDLEFEPAFSPDGKEIVFVSWNDANYGAVMKLNLKSNKGQKLTTLKGIYRTPAYSADGKWIVFVKEEGNDHQGFSYSKENGIYMIPSSGGEGRLVSNEGEFPQFSKDGKRIYFQTGGYLFGSLEKAFKSVDLYGKDERTHFTSKYANRFVLSDDNKWLAFNELFKVYIAPFAQTGKPIDLSAGIKTIPVSQVSRDAGINIHWSADNKKLHWTLGDEYFTNEISKRFTFLEGSTDSIPPLDTTGIKIGLRLKSDKPSGIIAFTNARIITMKGDEVIENGTLVVDGNRIISVGKSGEVTIPKNAKIINSKGKTIMPGMVDVHSHLGTFRYGLSPQKQWSYYANLAYGVTTTHDPSSNTEMVFSQSDMVRSGEMVGPRIYSTGIILYGAEGDFKAVINNQEDALSALRRTHAFGAFSVKSYNQPRRDQRQQVINAARELGMMVVPEGGSHFQHNMSMIADGHTGIEHNIPVAPLYDDVIQFWSASKTGYTPTLIVNYGGINGENYYYERDKVWENKKLLQFVPQSIVDSRARHRTIIPEEEYINGHILVSQSCKKISDAGVKLNLGSHGQLQGLGAHWELWMLQAGGMTNMEALRAVTFNGAAYIGMDKEIGSLENGKLADLIIMDKNPLENIRNTETIKFVMINGRLYDTETMNETGLVDKKRDAFYWQVGGQNVDFPFHEETGSFEDGKCGCGKH
ncbi:MAG: amidohydrolase, partial [Sphingobacteriales bacterium]